jgi:hypothetical protein
MDQHLPFRKEEGRKADKKSAAERSVLVLGAKKHQSEEVVVGPPGHTKTFTLLFFLAHK